MKMIDREKTIKGLEHLSEWLFQQYRVVYDGDVPNYYDAYKTVDGVIAMLKEQEPVKPCVAVDTWICPKCGHALESQNLIDDKENPQVLVHELYSFCPNCGQAVKWDE